MTGSPGLPASSSNPQAKPTRWSLPRTRPEPTVILFMIDGALIYLDKPVEGTMVALEDVFSALEMFRDYYRANGLDELLLNKMIR